MNDYLEMEGNIVDVVAKNIFRGKVIISAGKIREILACDTSSDRYILPGLIDAHIHVESSMLIPSEFARLAVVHGTVATVSDPHEIANVLGVEGVKFMIENGRKVPFRFYFGAPSCVPATPFETAGATLGVEEVRELLEMNEIRYLSEMMNFPGVLSGDPEVMAKIELARNLGKPVDGHAPGVKGTDVEKYIRAGISTDHECFTLEEAREKIGFGMHILIREGSAARNFETLWPLVDEYPGQVMLCSDDKHPDDLEEGHINRLVKRALGHGLDLMNTLRCCTLNPVKHYGLDAGLLQPGDPADFICVDNLADFNVLETWIGGVRVAESGRSLINSVTEVPCNNFQIQPIQAGELIVNPEGRVVKVICAREGQLVTGLEYHEVPEKEGNLVSDPARDILKLVVRNRYREAPAAVGFIRNIGLKRGAIASSVAHDSHNIVAVGADDASLLEAINLVIRSEGGISLCDGDLRMVLPLPFAGIMSGDDGYEVARKYKEIDRLAKLLGSTLPAPYMTLSFMALLVIPDLKLSDKGLFDGTKFEFTPVLKK